MLLLLLPRLLMLRPWLLPRRPLLLWHFRLPSLLFLLLLRR